jgi:hypothetical protein
MHMHMQLGWLGLGRPFRPWSSLAPPRPAARGPRGTSRLAAGGWVLGAAGRCGRVKPAVPLLSLLLCTRPVVCNIFYCGFALNVFKCGYAS